MCDKHASFLLFYAMFEKISKRFGGKATDNMIEGAKETLNDRMDKYSDIIQIGLVVAVIALGGNKLIGHSKKQPECARLPQGYEPGSGSPIVINNYYSNPIERNPYRNQKGVRHGGSGKNNQKR